MIRSPYEYRNRTDQIISGRAGHDGGPCQSLFPAENNELILGPFQGRPACTHIPFSKGVCGAAYRTSQVQLVPDVTAIADHIACDSASRSELCVPVLVNGECVLLIDMDAPTIAYFTEEMAAEQKEAAKEIASAWIAHRWPN